MKRILIVLITIISFDALGQEYKVYRALIMRGTPYADLTPKGMVKNGEDSPVDNFKAYYDEHDRLVKLEHYFFNRISNQMYDGNGYLSFGSPLIKISYIDNKEIREYYDAAGQPFRNNNGVFKDEFTLDSQGFRQSLIYFDSVDSQITNTRGVYRYEWETREDGRYVIEKRFDKNGNLVTLSDFMDFLVTHMTFSESGYRTGFINYGEEGKQETTSDGRKISRTQVTWDELLGNELRIAFLDNEGNPKNLEKIESANDNYGHAFEVYDWDSLGNQIGFRTLDANGQLVNRANQSIAYQYFPTTFKGLTDVLINYDQGMDMAPDQRGVYQTKFVYDKKGNLEKMMFLDQYGRLMAGIEGIAYQYQENDDQNRPTLISYHRVNGELVETPRGTAKVEFSYNEDGDRTMKRYNKNGELIQ